RKLAHGAYAIDEVPGAAVAKIVPIHAGDDHVAQAERGDRLREIQRLVGVERQRTAVAHVAERAPPRAEVAHDHERRCALAEALADVRARRFLAHRVQLVVAQDPLDLVEPRRRRCAHADPVRLLEPFRGNDLYRVFGEYARGLGAALVLDARRVRFGIPTLFHRHVPRRWAMRIGASPAPARSTDIGTPRSASCVTASPRYPHGSMSSNGARSIAMFTARP